MTILPATECRALYVTDIAETPRLEWRTMQRPRPERGEVLVKISAVTISWGDAIQAQGKYVGGALPPYIPGHDFSGCIVETTADVPSAWRGRRVFGLLPYGGALCEYVTMPAEWINFTPDNIGDTEAAAVSASFFTADAALNFLGPPKIDGTFLIHGGAGGLGSAAIQLCRALGEATVIATAGTEERRRFAGTCGAQHTSSYDDFPALVADVTGGRGVDFVLESIGGDVFDRSIAALGKFGRIVSVGASAAKPTGPLRMARLWRNSLSIAGVHLSSWITDHPERLGPTKERVAHYLSTGHVKPIVDQTFPGCDTAEAFHRLSARSVQGRVAIVVSEQ